MNPEPPEAAEEDALPASSASIPAESLTTATVMPRWSASAPWLLLAATLAVVGGAGLSVDALALALLCGAGAGLASAKVIVARRRRVRLQGERLVQDGLLGTTELRLKDITHIKAAGSGMSTTTARPLAPERLAYRAESGSISFAELEPRAASAVSQAVLQAIAPRLVDEFMARLAAGGTVAFGYRVHATADGLIDTGSGLTLRWSEIERADVTPAGVRVFALDRPDLTLTSPTWSDNAVLLEPLVKRQQLLLTAPPQARGDVEVVGWPVTDVRGGRVVCGIERASPLPWAIFGVTLFTALGAALIAGAEGLAAIAAVVAFFGSITAVANVIMQRRRAFAVFERGVADSGGFVAFSEVAHLKRAIVDQYANGGYVGRSVTLVLTDHRGRSVRLSGSGDRVEAVAAAALRRALPPLVERARRTIAKGGSVRSGTFVVDEHGVHKKKVAVTWDEIDSAIVEGGFLHVWRKGVERSVLTLAVDQADALVVLELIGERLDRRKQPAGAALGGELRELFAQEPVLVDVDAPVGARR